MENTYFSASAVLLINTLFGLYILAVMIRFLLQSVRADFYNPIAQFLVKVTGPVVKPLRRVIPGLWGIDLSSVVLMLILQFIELYLVAIAVGQSVSVPSLSVIACGELIALFLNVFLFAIIIQAILSWFGPGTANPFTSILYSLTEPVLRPFRSRIPPISGIDLSPLVALLAIQLLKILIVSPILDIGYSIG